MVTEAAYPPDSPKEEDAQAGPEFEELGVVSWAVRGPGSKVVGEEKVRRQWGRGLACEGGPGRAQPGEAGGKGRAGKENIFFFFFFFFLTTAESDREARKNYRDKGQRDSARESSGKDRIRKGQERETSSGTTYAALTRPRRKGNKTKGPLAQNNRG